MDNPETEKPKEISSKIFWTALIAGIVFFMLIMGLFLGMCGWYNPKVLYVRKNDSSIKIVERSYGCGAYDSGSPKKGYFKIKELTSFLNWTTEIDINDVNKTQWTEYTVNNEKNIPMDFYEKAALAKAAADKKASDKQTTK